MALRDQIQADLADAMRARDETRKSVLRMLVAAVHNAEIPDAPADGAETGERQQVQLDDDAVVGVIQKQLKQRRDSIDQYRKAGRTDLAEKEEAEAEILAAYLPKQADREEIEAAARKVISEAGASGPRDMGKVMPVLTKQFAGRADGRMINEVVRGLLNS
ncbi:MAG: GatB/YqeY domain-containing protein [Dehalococcoidia bacterium]|nr:GatB/YqeY domain-containing protein [Dehalococcoidia bacterium]